MTVKLTIDCIVLAYDAGKGTLNLLLVKRKNAPGQGAWALPGGFVREPEELEDVARSILQRETGVKQIYMDQLKAYGLTDATPGNRIVSVAFYALVSMPARRPGQDAQWFPVYDIPDLPFDHGIKVRDAMARVREMTSLKPLAFNCLPRQFTLNQLHRFYETLYNRPLDNRNFRKSALAMSYIEALGKKETSVDHRPAELYRFNRKYLTKMGNFGRLF